MKIHSIEISNVAGVRHLNIFFDQNMNLICGPNGIGKTTILECLAHTFSTSKTNILKRNVAAEKGQCTTRLTVEGEERTASISVDEFEPGPKGNLAGLHQYSNRVLSLKVSRTFNYQELQAVNKDRITGNTWQEAQSGLNIHETKNWFVNRYLYSAHDKALSIEQIHNLELAKSCFSLLSGEFSFSHVAAHSNEIMVNSPDGEIYYEYLSSGFKSCLSILFAIIKDIELRFNVSAR